MRAKIVRLSVICEITWATSERLQNFFFHFSAIFENNLQNPPNFFEETSEISLQQPKFRHGKFNMNDLKSLKKGLVTYEIF